MSGQRTRITVNQDDMYSGSSSSQRHRHQKSSSRHNSSRHHKHTSPGPYDSRDRDGAHERTSTQQDRSRRGGGRSKSANPPLAENSSNDDEDYETLENAASGSASTDAASDDEYDNTRNNNNSRGTRSDRASDRNDRSDRTRGGRPAAQSLDEPYHVDSDNEEDLQADAIRRFEEAKRRKAQQMINEAAGQKSAQKGQNGGQQGQQGQQKKRERNKKKRERRERKARTPNPNEIGDDLGSHQNASQNHQNNRGRSTGNAGDRDKAKQQRRARKSRSRTRADPDELADADDQGNEEYGMQIRRPGQQRLGAGGFGGAPGGVGAGGVGNKPSALKYDPTARNNTWQYNSSNAGAGQRHSVNTQRTRNRTKGKGKDKDRRLTVDVPRRGADDRQDNGRQQRRRGDEFGDYNQYSGDDAFGGDDGRKSPMADMGDLGALDEDRSRVLKSPKPGRSPNSADDDQYAREQREQSREQREHRDQHGPSGQRRSRSKNRDKEQYKMTQNGAYRDENNHARRRRRSASKSATPMPKNGKQGLTPGARMRGDKVQSQSGRRSKSKKSKESKLNRGKLAEDYWIKEKMGKGNFAVVRRAIRKSDNREFAAKIISKKHLSSREIAELDNEVDILCKLYHPNVVEVVEVLDTPRHLYIVLELLTGGELFDRIVSKGRFTEQQAANITKQLASALKYLHSIRIVHRDLKPENIIYKTPSDDAPIKITDFGLGRDMGQDPKESGYRKTLNTACGTPGYVAPEILKAHPYDEYVDLWSCGVILYIMLCGYPPFTGGRNQNKLYRKIKRGEYSFPSPAWDNVSAMAKDCVKSLLTVDPRNRMSAAELLDHPWVQNTEIHAGKNLVNEEFAANLTHYLHKKRLRRGVELVIILNRMIRAAGLEKIAKEQRKQFRQRLLMHKAKVKQEKWDEIEGYRKQGLISDKDYAKLNMMKTPPIDYSKV